MTTAAKIIGIARSQIGTKESPRGSNRVKYTSWYGMIGPWCAMFVSWCAAEAGISTTVIPKHAYTPSGRNWFRSRKQWGTKPRVGAIAYYNLSGLGRVSHVGIVERVYSDGSFDAIEGNTDYRGGRTGGQVMRKRRKALGAGGGFGYPKYTGKASAGTTATQWRKVDYGDTLRRGVQGAPVKDVQRAAGVTADGYFGADTEKAVRAFQTRHRLPADGIVGPATWAKVKAAQPKKAPTKSARGRLAVDGKLGPNTIKALQRDLGVTADGQIGPKTARALQKRLGVKADGIIGRNTVRALQRRVGSKVDGAWGPATTRKLQERLNRGKL